MHQHPPHTPFRVTSPIQGALTGWIREEDMGVTGNPGLCMPTGQTVTARLTSITGTSASTVA
jgi:hypothetical protein